MFIELVTALITSALAASLRAQEPASRYPINIAALAGGDDFTGSLGKKLGPGLVIGAAALVTPGQSRFSLRTDASYLWFREKGCDLVGSTCVDQLLSSHLVAWSIDVIARLNSPSARWSPYGVIGGALYSFSGDMIAHPRASGAQVGIGIEFKAPVGVNFIELRRMDMAPGALTAVTIGKRVTIR